LPKNGLFKNGPDDLLYHLVFFNTFEELKLPIKGPMEDAGVIKLSEPSPTPCLYVAPVENISGNPPNPVVFGRQLNTNSSLLLQQAQGFRLPMG
jgi:hypothetical protein